MKNLNLDMIKLNKVIKSTEFDPSNISYSEPKQLSGGRGKTVYVHYTGLLETGKKFDSSHDRGQTFSFKLGQGRVIKGWEEALSLMKPGEKRTLIIPPELGYGERGQGPIPPNSILIFEVELVKVM